MSFIVEISTPHLQGLYRPAVPTVNAVTRGPWSAGHGPREVKTSGRGRAVRQLPAGTHVVAGVPVRVILEVVLVLRLGLPERSGRGHFGDDLPRPQAGGVDVSD